MNKHYALILCVALAMGGCSSPQSAENKLKEINEAYPEQEIIIKAMGNTMDDMKYDITEVVAYEKSTLRITLVNQSTDASMQHNLVLIRNGKAAEVAEAGLQAGAQVDYVKESDDVLAWTKLTKPGEISSITINCPAAGVYEYVCTYPGHWSTMRGRLVVKSSR